MQLYTKYIHEEQIKLCTAFHQQFKPFSAWLSVAWAHSALKQTIRVFSIYITSNNTWSVCWKIPLNACGKSFHIVHQTVVGQLRCISLIVFQHCIPYIIHFHINLVHILFTCTSESQLNYLFQSKKNLLKFK